MAHQKSILVTGATGKQGGAVLKHLHELGEFKLLAVTRNTTSGSAQRIVDKYPGTILVQGDLNDVPALFASAKTALRAAGEDDSIWGVYSVQVSMGSGTTYDGEIKQGNDLIDESIKHGVKHFVFSSVDRGGNEKSWNNPTDVPHFKTKNTIEHHLLEKAGKEGENMGWTILRPVAFMDNLEPGFAPKVFLAALKNTLGEKPVQWVSIQDIGLFAANAFHDPERYNKRAIGLAGDDLTFDQLSERFKKVLGHGAPVTFGLLGRALLLAVPEMKTMLNWFRDEGYGVDIEELRKEEPKLTDFETWLREQSKFRTSQD
ncbi:NmrA family protein-like protein [Westerdykella ornata]|uniref:NmrA family protein-like protein n=1 Tax=Westerdykella ornata TaxID=318751 RepID=A0A6A6JR81_WESOR|nr:NmrA family protein-like protein [Westerdykella ornata]KAF2278613.1 NmrA family protein-like protein [Westerdykella ornata]